MNHQYIWWLIWSSAFLVPWALLFSFGTYWAGVYEHVTWQRPAEGAGALGPTEFSYEHRAH